LIGSKIHLFEEVESTNDIAKRFALEGGEEGTVIISDSQSRGKGRDGHSWLSPKGMGIYLSVILKPNIPPTDVSQLTIVAGVATAQAIQDVSHISISIKLPNDLMIRGKKLGGILLETSSTGNTLNYVIIGIGINVNTDVSSFPQGVRSIATSIKEEKGVSLKRIRLIQRLLERLDEWYKIYISGGMEDIMKVWSEFVNRKESLPCYL
jgi:BirA family biotin operon repressor/biotin-[acetyl-CoA-carboxylase] ligase